MRYIAIVSLLGFFSLSAFAGGMESALGSYAMTRDSSGTSWQPEATPLTGKMWMGDSLLGESWMVMANAALNVIYDDQGGRRGDTKTFANSMGMLMASRPLGSGIFGLRTMVSLDPFMGKSGYPLLLQTGETADGKTHLADRQHPHDALMEVAATYSLPVAEEQSVYGYIGLPGEPALGPPAFMHRFSGMDNPEAPISHHWLDSTHVIFGVATLGYNLDKWKIEGSIFNGREPDQYRWNIETRKFDSASARLSYTPTENWALQISRGYFKSPEQLEPEVSVHRTTASASYQQHLTNANWQTTFAWGQNDKNDDLSNAYLLESAFVLTRTHTFFGRLERVKNDELFQEEDPLHGRGFNVNKLSLGYIYDFARMGQAVVGVGGLISTYKLPSELHDAYGADPLSTMLFVRVKL
jgi:hypothetical protein